MLLKKQTLGFRIYLSMIALIVISLLITGMATIYFFKKQNDSYHLGRLQRKEQAILLALKYYVVEREIDQVNTQLEKKIDELANIHSLDLNIYNEFGRLHYTTIDSLGNQELANAQLPEPMVQEVSKSTDPIIVEEELENQPYLSTYFMLTNRFNHPIALVNIPYHKDSKQSTADLRGFFNTLIQVFLLLFVGASVIAYFLSNYITKSLDAVSKGIERTQLKGENPHIEWHSDDEIGTLVRAYNQMVDELQTSAQLLAKSERELAWKEMARQVAHEIKNPLTPMRLNVQHLQRSYADNPAELQERIAKFSRVMIEQIDTLSRIANEFSNFAKMPVPELTQLNLPDTLQGAVDLYVNTPNVEVLFENKVNDEVTLLADRKQLIRAIGNLLKNAIQAIPEGRMGKVLVTLKKEENQLIVLVSDNGKGIPESEKERIFAPYFTTKSGGTGLGLAMVKNIVEEIGGRISYTSAAGAGTTFKVTFSS